MTTVTVKGADKVTEAMEWLKRVLPKARFTLEVSQSDPFSGIFDLMFEQPNDAVVFALRWGNEYGNR
jgi:hypothetical protein